MTTEEHLDKCVEELQRLWDCHHIQYEGKVGEPEIDVIEAAKKHLIKLADDKNVQEWM